MTKIKLSIPPELKKEMEKFPEINWSEVARNSIKQKNSRTKFFESFNDG